MDTPLGPILVVEDDEGQAVVIRSFFEHRSLGAVVRIGILRNKMMVSTPLEREGVQGKDDDRALVG